MISELRSKLSSAPNEIDFEKVIQMSMTLSK